MERVSFQRFARIFLRNALESAGSGQVDGQRREKHENCSEARLDVHAMEEEAVKRLINDVERG